MIASYGGLEIKADGSRSYPGSGGMVGGLSFPFAGTSRFTGAGKAYYTFIPSNDTRCTDCDGGSGDTGGGGTGGGGGIIIPSSGGGTGTGTGGGIIFPTGGVPTFNVPSSPYRNLSGITSGGNQLISVLNSIFGQLQANNPNLTQAQALQLAQQYAAYLNNPSVFYQARHGDDASALQRFRAQASAIVSAIAGWFTPVSNTDTGGKTTGGGTTPTDCLWDCDGSLPTDIPILPNSILNQLVGLLGAGARTNVEAPPNLFSFNPNQTGGTGSMQKYVLLAVAIVAAWWLYKKYA
jgi:hypothetical protein